MYLPQVSEIKLLLVLKQLCRVKVPDSVVLSTQKDVTVWQYADLVVSFSRHLIGCCFKEGILLWLEVLFKLCS